VFPLFTAAQRGQNRTLNFPLGGPFLILPPAAQVCF